MKKVFLFLLATMQLHDALTSDQMPSDQMPTDYFDPLVMLYDGLNQTDIDPTITFYTPPQSSLQPYQQTPAINYSQAPGASISTINTGYIPLSQNQNQNYICQFCMTRCTTSSELAIHEEICIDNPKNLIAPLMQAAQPPQPAQLQQQPFVFAVPQPTGTKSTRTKRKKTSNHNNNNEPTGTIVTDIQTPQPPTPEFSTLGNISSSKKFLCLECPSKDDYKNEGDLIKHSTTHSSTIKAKNLFSWKHICHLCNRKFGLPRSLNTHLDRHYDIKKFVCPSCHKPFTTKDNCDSHYNTMHTTLPSKTKFDVKSFQKPSLQVAVIDPFSTSTQKFLCLKCTNRENLGSKEALQKHYRETHPETANNPKELKYYCELCGKKFGWHTQLKDHVNAHYDIKNYICSLCDGRYVSSSELKKHISRKHPEVLASAIDFDTTNLQTPLPPTPSFTDLGAPPSPSQTTTDTTDIPLD